MTSTARHDGMSHGAPLPDARPRISRQTGQVEVVIPIVADSSTTRWDKVVGTADRLSRIISRLTLIPCIAAMGAMTVVVVVGVFFRYVLRNPLGWSEELSRYLMIWGALLAVSVAIQTREHVGISIVMERIPIRFARVITIVTKAIMIYFLAVLSYRGYAMAQRGTSQLAMSLGISMYWPLMAVPVSGALSIVQLVLQAIVDTRMSSVRALMGIPTIDSLTGSQERRARG